MFFSSFCNCMMLCRRAKKITNTISFQKIFINKSLCLGIYIQNHRTWSERSRVFNWNHCRTNLFQQRHLPEAFQQRLRLKNNDGWILIKSFFPSSCPCTRVGKPSSCARVGKLSSCLGEKTGTRSSQRRKIHLLAETQIWVSGRLGSCCILPVNGPITAIYSKIFFLFSWRYCSRKYFFFLVFWNAAIRLASVVGEDAPLKMM